MKKSLFLTLTSLLIVTTGFGMNSNNFRPYQTQLPFKTNVQNSYVAVATCVSPGYPTLTVHVSSFSPTVFSFGVDGDTANAFSEFGYVNITTSGVYFSGFSTSYLGNAGSGYIAIPDGFYPYD